MNMQQQEVIEICNKLGYKILAYMRKPSNRISEKTLVYGVIVQEDEFKEIGTKLTIEKLKERFEENNK